MQVQRSARLVLVTLVFAALAAGGRCGGGGAAEPDGSSAGDGGGPAPDGAGPAPDGRPADSARTDAPSAGDIPRGDAPGEVAPACVEGALRCLSAGEVGRCDGSAWILVRRCADGEFCEGGTCVVREDCAPGTTGGCWSVTAYRLCLDSGAGYVPVDCSAGTYCIAGDCVVTQCEPQTATCLPSGELQSCGPDGRLVPPVACPTGQTCVAGRCLSGCQGDPKWQSSSIGCEYWTVDLDQSDVATLFTDHTPPAEAPHSVVLSNPGTLPATVTFSTRAAGIVLPVASAVIEPGAVREFVMPRMDLDGAGVFDRSVRIQSSRPLVATQFNPKDVANTYSNDSSLLLPVEVLGTEYLVLGWPSQAELPFAVYPPLLGYFTVVAVAPGTTTVAVTLASEGLPVVPGGAALPAGETHVFTLEQYEVLQLQGISRTLDFENDLSGSSVVSDQPIAVFTGHEGPLICPEESHVLCPVEIGEEDGNDCSCCLEHLEEQLWPVVTWSRHYLVGKAPPRGYVDFDTYRVQAGADNVTLTTDPPIAGLHGRVLARKGEWVQAAADISFALDATGPVQIAQYIASMACTSDMTGDPAQIMVVGTHQYRDSYPFLVPSGYAEDWVTVVRPLGSTTTLDGAPVAAAFEPIGASGYEVGYLPVTPGAHLVEGPAPFGLSQYGFFEATSYGNPAGLNLVVE